MRPKPRVSAGQAELGGNQPFALCQALDQMGKGFTGLIRFPPIPTRSGFVLLYHSKIDPEMSRMALAPPAFSPPGRPQSLGSQARFQAGGPARPRWLGVRVFAGVPPPCTGRATASPVLRLPPHQLGHDRFDGRDPRLGLVALLAPVLERCRRLFKPAGALLDFTACWGVTVGLPTGLLSHRSFRVPHWLERFFRHLRRPEA